MSKYPVHPHTRGENDSDSTYEAAVYGSSPHAWGKHIPLHVKDGVFRFIPTRVGKTLIHGPLQNQVAVHPHTRGENVYPSALTLASSGSSPHAWGKLFQTTALLNHTRFIPTRVGKTTRGHRGSRGTAVHPHTRGENCCMAAYSKTYGGSSPHAWGKPSPSCIPPPPSPVHPHTRGENADSFRRF